MKKKVGFLKRATMSMRKSLSVPEAGFSLVEVLIAVAILVSLFFAIASQFSDMRSTVERTSKQTQAGFLLEEGVEVAKLLRSKSYLTYIEPLATSTPYYLFWNSTTSSWSATTTPQVIDQSFTREFILEEVYRDANGDIAPAGVLDPGSRKLTVTVFWEVEGATSSEQLVTYIMDLYEN